VAERHAAPQVAVGPDVLHEPRAGAQLRLHRGLDDALFLVDDLRIEDYEIGPRPFAGEELAHERELVREPDVVLVGEHDRLALRLPDGILEVAQRAVEGISVEDADARVGEGPHERKGVVRGAIVRDDELVLRLELLQDRRDLALDETGAVEGGHADRDHATIVLASGPVAGRGGPVASGGGATIARCLTAL
jgi:hypothetical protein